ncbi:MAG: PhzF family phenazine biosynthesis protein [Rhodobacteraceae bacterium]|nr:PhzF family phenazine biosynthesis protein [Paracoccaceae bacterium]
MIPGRRRFDLPQEEKYLRSILEPKAIEAHVVNGFDANRAGGYPAGALLGYDELTDVQMQPIAAREGLPETAFVSCHH